MDMFSKLINAHNGELGRTDHPLMDSGKASSQLLSTDRGTGRRVF